MLEGGAQLRPAAVDAAAHGAQLDAERRGDLLVGEALDVAEHDGRAEVRRQGVERALDVVVEVRVVVDLGRAGLAAGEPLGRVVGEPVEADPLLAADLVEEQVRGDPVQPALEGARGVGRAATGRPGRTRPGSGPRRRAGCRSAGRRAGRPAPSASGRPRPSSGGVHSTGTAGASGSAAGSRGRGAVRLGHSNPPPRIMTAAAALMVPRSPFLAQPGRAMTCSRKNARRASWGSPPGPDAGTRLPPVHPPDPVTGGRHRRQPRVQLDLRGGVRPRGRGPDHRPGEGLRARLRADHGRAAAPPCAASPRPPAPRRSSRSGPGPAWGRSTCCAGCARTAC